jgi:Mg-chelatase subunit ChlD
MFNKPCETQENQDNQDGQKDQNVNISILQGSKLFNNFSPFIININSPDTMLKKSNVDLICIIDISGSMKNQKLSLVKESLKSLISFMDEKDRMALVLFNDKGTKYLDLSFLTAETKRDFKSKIDKITSRGGTNILSGLEIAVNILKEEKLKEDNNINNDNNENIRVKSLMLLSDGNDNDYNDIEIADGLKNLTKGFNLSFTLHTFGYGEDYDPKIMSRLANLRDGSFYMVDQLDRVQDYFVNSLGGCMSVIYNEAKLKIKVLKPGMKIKKVFGMDKLYESQLKDDYFETKILQFISGKEYTFTIEVELPDLISINDNILEVELIGDSQSKKQVGKYQIVGGAFSVADEEYLRSKLFDTLDQALKLKEQNKNVEMNKLLNEMKDWIKTNYEGDKKNQYIRKIDEVLGLVQDNYVFESRGRSRITADICENQLKRPGVNFSFSNKIQSHMVSSITNTNKIKPSTYYKKP